MKRSEINALLRETVKFCREQKFHLPPWAFWSSEDWKQAGPETAEIKRNMLGWDITDFGSGRFHDVGLLLFTIRNGNPNDPENLKTYCEKMLIVEPNQVTPMHYHWDKVEDIINRGGGELVIELYNASAEDTLADTEVIVSTDGIERTVPPGTKVRLKPGESITLPQKLYHKFWAEGGKVLAGEVSAINDDTKDNCFLDELPRFPGIEEDEKPLYLLCHEYPE